MPNYQPVSPDKIIGMLRNGVNPQQLVMSFLDGQLANNPLGQNLIALAKQGKSEDITAIARNICAAKGVDFDKEFSAFLSQLKR